MRAFGIFRLVLAINTNQYKLQRTFNNKESLFFLHLKVTTLPMLQLADRRGLGGRSYFASLVKPVSTGSTRSKIKTGFIRLKIR